MSELSAQVRKALDAAVTAIGGSPRDGQIEMAEAVANALTDRHHLMVQAGTGTGKSAIGITIARYLENNFPTIKDENGDALTGAYVLTTQKILQDQYVRDFGPGSKLPVLRTIKSSSIILSSFKSKSLLFSDPIRSSSFSKFCPTLSY